MAHQQLVGQQSPPSPSLVSVLGYRLGVGPSTIPQAGRGLFVKEGMLKEGDIITTYPGAIYGIPHDLETFVHVDDAWASRPPEFMVDNDYLVRFLVTDHRNQKCQILVDGCPRGLSKLMFGIILEREGETRNTSWLDEDYDERSKPADYCAKRWEHLLSTPSTYAPAALCTGHLINDSGPQLPNAEFRLGVLPWGQIPPYIMAYLGNINVSMKWAYRVGLCVPLVVAKRDLAVGVAQQESGIELFVRYGVDPTHMGYSS